VSKDKKPKTKLYGFITDIANGLYYSAVITEHGRIINAWVSNEKKSVPFDLGMFPSIKNDHHGKYDLYCKDGWIPCYVQYEEVDSHVELQKALKRLVEREDLEDDTK